ncbi:hypothetical protein [Helicobacter sp. 23-1045]
MSKKDEVKAQIGIFKFWLGVVVATLLALIGWCATNYQNVETWLLILSLVLSFVCFILIVWIYNKINKKIKKLRRL